MREMKNLYLEKLKRMSDEELIDECEKMGKIMERLSPMTKEEKSRAYMCFRFVAARPDISEDNRIMLQTALKVLRLL